MFLIILLAKCPNGTQNIWDTTRDQHAKYGTGEDTAKTLEDCRKKCISNMSCDAIDYKEASTTTKCWLFFNSSSITLTPEDGIVHDSLRRCVPESKQNYTYLLLFKCTEKPHTHDTLNCTQT